MHYDNFLLTLFNRFAAIQSTLADIAIIKYILIDSFDFYSLSFKLSVYKNTTFFIN